MVVLGHDFYKLIENDFKYGGATDSTLHIYFVFDNTLVNSHRATKNLRCIDKNLKITI